MDADVVGLPVRWRRGRSTVAGSCSSSSPPRKPRATRWATTARRHVVLADRRQQRVEVDVAELVDHLAGSCVERPHPLHRQALAAELLGELVAAGLDHVDAALAAEPLADLVAGPRRRDEAAASPATARRVSTLDVKISHVSPLRSWWSSDTSRPLTLAPMQAWPTSVCTA